MTMDVIKARWAAIEMAEKRMRSLLRLGMPRTDVMADKYPRFVRPTNSVALFKCNTCNSPPKIYTCQICDAEFTEKWMMQVHIMGGNELCARIGERKEKQWAADVGLDP